MDQKLAMEPCRDRIGIPQDASESRDWVTCQVGEISVWCWSVWTAETGVWHAPAKGLGSNGPSCR